MVVTVAFGTFVGLYAGYHGGWVDTLLMRLTDAMMAIPAILVALALAGLMDGKEIALPPDWMGGPWLSFKLQRGTVGLFIVIGLVSWTGIARIVRSQVLALKHCPFVDAARALGFSHRRVIWRHVFPNVLPRLLVLVALSTAWAITVEAGVSYLGVGIPPPAPSWGGMIGEGQPYLIVAPWSVVPAGLAIFVAVLGFNLLGQGLQNVLSPDSH